jgi:DNA uptake protein ComE-like DNA-binding protein
MKLPGIGEAISAKIIAGRPWANKAQLLSKGLVSKPVYDKLSALVIAKKAK